MDNSEPYIRAKGLRSDYSEQSVSQASRNEHKQALRMYSTKKAYQKSNGGSK